MSYRIKEFPQRGTGRRQYEHFVFRADGGGARNEGINATARHCLAQRRWRLNFQTHKILRSLMEVTWKS